MPRNKITDLRNHLFAAIEGLNDEDNPMEIEKALAIAKLGSVIVNTAKLEVQYMKAMGAETAPTDFLEQKKIEIGTTPDNKGQLPTPN